MMWTLQSSVTKVNFESVELRRTPFNLNDEDAKQTERQERSMYYTDVIVSTQKVCK